MALSALGAWRSTGTCSSEALGSSRQQRSRKETSAAPHRNASTPSLPLILQALRTSTNAQTNSPCSLCQAATRWSPTCRHQRPQALTWRPHETRTYRPESHCGAVSFRGTSREPRGLSKQQTVKAGTLHTFPHCCSSAVRVLSQAGHGLRLQFTAPWT